MPRFNYMVLARPKPGREAEYDQWHREVHVDDVLKIPGMVACTRYRLLDPQPDGQPPRWLFASIYEVDAEDPAAPLAEMKRRVGTDLMPMTDASDSAHTLRLMFEPLSRHEAKAHGAADAEEAHGLR